MRTIELHDRLLAPLEGSVGISSALFDENLKLTYHSPNATELIPSLAMGLSLAKALPHLANYEADIRKRLAAGDGTLPADLPAITASATVNVIPLPTGLVAWIMPAGSGQAVDSLAMISHEIRTPLNTVIGMSELLATTSMSAAQQKYLDILSTAAESLLELINNLLDLHKLDAGRMEIREEPFYLQDLVDSTLDVLALRAHSKGLELSSTIRPDVPTYLIGDPEHLRQILINLVGNAVKFTQAGHVSIHVRLGDDPTLLRFIVTDTGPGVPQSRRSRLFLPYWQLHSAARSREGTGLGLSISKQLAEAMGGSLWHEDVPGGGSRFVFSAHFKPQDRPERLTVRAAFQVAQLKVLIVDDNPTAALSAANLLAFWGPRVDVAHTRREALSKIQKAHTLGEGYEMVMVDGNLEPAGGFAFVHEVQRDQPNIMPLITLTSMQLEKDIEAAEDMGIAYIIKPLKKEELFRTINRMLVEGRSSPEFETSTKGPELTVLFVDDAHENRLFVDTILSDAGHTVTSLASPFDALTLLAQKQFDVIVLDIQMPGMDGYELARKIRILETREGRPRSPLIALTAFTFQSHIDACLEAGFDAHLAKPVTKKALLHKVEMIARPKQEAALTDELINEGRMALVRRDFDGIEVFADRLQDLDPAFAQLSRRLREAARARDRDQLKSLVDMLHEFEEVQEEDTKSDVEQEIDSALQHLVPAFLARRQADVVDLRAAIQKHDFDEVAVFGHRMAGSGTTYGFVEISRIGGELEEAARQQSIPQAKALVDQLESYLAAL